MHIGNYTIDISNRDKVFYPDEGITKGDVIDYYDKVSDHLLPYLKDRPLSLQRFPDGINGDGFYQKEVSDYFPEWIKTEKVEKKEDGTVKQVICNSKATLIYLVNQGTLSFHPWLSKISDLNKPDKLVFDLDPPKDNFEIVIEGAKALRTLLEEELDLNTFLMTTGSEGMHVVCPIKATVDFEEVRAFTRGVAEFLAGEHSDAFTTEVRKNKRNDRLFLDYLRNAYAQTSILPYSLRAIKGAPIATPLSWDEINKKDLGSQSYHIKNIFRRLSQKDDPWPQFRNKAKKLDGPMKKLNQMKKNKNQS